MPVDRAPVVYTIPETGHSNLSVRPVVNTLSVPADQHHQSTDWWLESTALEYQVKSGNEFP